MLTVESDGVLYNISAAIPDTPPWHVVISATNFIRWLADTSTSMATSEVEIYSYNSTQRDSCMIEPPSTDPGPVICER